MIRKLSALIGVLLVAWPAPAQNPPPESKFFNTHWIAQDQYIEMSILKDAGSMLFYAKNGQAGPVDVVCQNKALVRITYLVTLAGKSLVITSDSLFPIWEPARYDSVAAQMASAIGLKKPRPKTGAVWPPAPAVGESTHSDARRRFARTVFEAERGHAGCRGA